MVGSIGKSRTIPLSLSLDVGESFDALEAFLEKLEDAVEKIIEDQGRAAQAEQWEEGYDEESYRHTLFQETLPRTLRYSTVLHAHAALDSLLSRLCDTFRDVSLSGSRGPT